jgi:hypothetical protein
MGYPGRAIEEPKSPAAFLAGPALMTPEGARRLMLNVTDIPRMH